MSPDSHMQLITFLSIGYSRERKKQKARLDILVPRNFNPECPRNFNKRNNREVSKWGPRKSAIKVDHYYNAIK